MTMYKLFPLLLSAFVVQACGLHGDYTSALSGGYFLRSEGGIHRDILNYDSGYKEIPANVLSFDYNDEFIVAKQRPADFNEPLYEGHYEYPIGNDTIYFWLVACKLHLIFGPLSQKEFEAVRRKYNVPGSLDVNRER